MFEILQEVAFQKLSFHCLLLEQTLGQLLDVCFDEMSKMFLLLVQSYISLEKQDCKDSLLLRIDCFRVFDKFRTSHFVCQKLLDDLHYVFLILIVRATEEKFEWAALNQPGQISLVVSIKNLLKILFNFFKINPIDLFQFVASTNPVLLFQLLQYQALS